MILRRRPDLASRDPHDVDGVADHVGGAPFCPLGPGTSRASLKLILDIRLKLSEQTF
jgi:hypothetical protein